MQFRTRKNKKDGRVPKIFITFEMNLHVKLIPFTMKQLCTLLCLLLLGGACSDNDTPNPAVKFSSPDSDVKISQDGTSAAITATHHAGQFILTMEKNFEAVPESDRSWCTAVLSGDRLTVKIEENAEELRNAAKLEINQLYSLSLQKIRDCIQQVLDKHAFTIQEKQLDKLCIRINNLFSILKHHSYSTAFVPDMDMQDTAIQLLCEEICEALKQTFDRKLPDMEQLFMYCYLLYYREHHIKGSIAVLVACQGEGIAEKYATHVNTMKYQVKCRYIDETGTASTRNLTAFLSTVVDKVREIDEGSGVVIITDFNPLLDFDSEIRSRTDIETVTLSPTSLPLLIQVMNMVNNPSIQLEDIRNYDYGTALQIPQSDSTGYGIEIQKTLDDVADKILSESLVFLNPKKATMALFRVLMKIYEDLGLNYTDEISIRFIFHSAFMIERVIRREPLIYKNTNSIISTNREVYTSIDRNMELVNDVFGISIPSSEIARLSEIFVDLINGCEQEECRTGID